jgi:hypothetical protein
MEPLTPHSILLRRNRYARIIGVRRVGRDLQPRESNGLRRILTVAAGAAQDDLVHRHVVPPPAGDAHDRSLERGILERLNLAAVVADEVVVMLAAGIRTLEARHAVTEVDPLHEPELVEAVEGAVHAREPNASSRATNAVVELLGGDAAVLSTEELDDRAARAAASAALRAHACKGAVDPALCHGR